MKQFKFYSLASAMLLAGAVGLNSCSSDSVEPGGTSGNNDVVKTQFAINIPRAGSNNGTRATGEQTQGDGTTFLGMKNIQLLGFNSNPTTAEASSISNITLEEIGNSEISASTSNKIYQDVSVETGISHFVFYGFGNITDDKLGAFADQLSVGAGPTTLKDIEFKLKPVLSSTISYTDGEAKKILDALNTIDQKLTSLDNVDNNLQTIHSQFRKLNAGSAKSVCALIQSLYDYVSTNYANMQDAVTQFKNTINSCEGFQIGDDGIVKVKDNLSFPNNVGLPDGAVSIEFDNSSNAFKYKEQTVFNAMSINPASITYPALLSYYANTPIYTSTSRVGTSQDNNQWPSTTENWKAENFTGWKTSDAKVESNTQAIALANNINYGVASLKLQVTCKANTLAQSGENASQVSVPTDGFKVTGLLIGGQPDAVDYKFSPKEDKFTKTIWDSEVNLNAKAETPSEANYTIVLPNLKAEGDQNEVLFALELENNGEAFQGKDGIVAKNAKFYLVGTLKAVNETGITLPEGVSKPSVFMSDYQTELTATISSLENAYNCIPDIRTTNMQLGLSVDLKWKTGIQYNIEIGGN